MVDYPGSGGWRPNTVRDKVLLGPDIPFLASQDYTVKRSGATFQQVAPVVAGVNEVQSLASSGASAGTFTLTFRGQTTPALPHTATAAAIQTALQALTTIGAGNLTAAGGPANSGATTLTFVGTLAGQDVELIGIDKSALTGGGAAAVTETTRGQLPNISELKKGTFVHPDPAGNGYYKRWATGETIIVDGSVGPSGFLMESIDLADGPVAEGVLIRGSVLRARVFPNPLPAAILTAIAGRIVLQ